MSQSRMPIGPLFLSIFVAVTHSRISYKGTKKV